MEDRLPSIEKLNEANWPIWKLQIQTYLEARELWSLCNGTETEPVVAEGANAAALNAHAQLLSKYHVRVARTKSILLQMISTSHVHIIAQHHLLTPHDMWRELQETFERPSLSNKLQLQTRLLDLKMESGSSVDNYFKEIQDLTERLAALGAPVEADFQVALVLRGLPSEYDALRVAFVTKGTVTMSELREALRTEEKRVNPDCGTVGASSGTYALSARGNRGRGRGKMYPRMKGPPGSCFGCGKMGHIHKNCPTNPYVPQNRSHVVKHMSKAAEYHSDVDDSSDNVDVCDNVDVSDDVMFTALYGVCNTSVSPDVWIIDSGATKHMSPCLDQFSDYVPFRVSESVSLGNGTVCDALGIGRVVVSMLCEGEVKRYTLSDVLYVPQLVNNFFSVTAATLKGHQVTFAKKQCTIHRDGKLIATGSSMNHIWYVDCLNDNVCAVLKPKSVTEQLALWHQRLGHVHEQRLKTAVNNDLIAGVNGVSGDLPFCEACVQAKQTRKPFKGLNEVQTTRKLQLVHSDVCGPMSVASLGGSRYFVTFTDDYTRCSRVYFMKQKSEVLNKFKEFESEVTNHAGLNILALRTDNGGEYTSHEFEAYLKLKGIRHELTVPYSPQQNGVAERLNRTLQETALSQIVHANLPKCFWADSIATACYVRNRLPAVPLNVSPYEKWYGKPPNVKHVRVFGCIAYALIPDVKRQKMAAKSEKMRFIGYPFGTKGYRLYDIKRHRVVVCRDVVFNESDFGVQKVVDPGVSVEDDKLVTSPVIVREHQPASATSDVRQPSPQHEQSAQPFVRRSSREVRPPNRFGDWIQGDKPEHLESVQAPVCDDSIRHCLYFHSIHEPATIAEALETPEANEWKRAADEEMKSLENMNTWKLVPLPEGRKTVNCRWVFKVKNKPDGTVDRFKARLVAKGYSQQPGIDYTETFAPVVRLNSLRSLLAYAVCNKLLIHQMDVVTAFLNGSLEEEVYMEQPPGYVKQGQEDLVCYLQRSLYGLKQSPRCWNKTFCDYLKNLKFVQLKADCCIFKREEPLTFIALYVDDVIVIAETDEVVWKTKLELSERFQMKDMGPLHYILGVSCIQDESNGKIGLTQEMYISKLIDKYGLTHANVVSTPSDPNVTLMKNDGISNPCDKSLYQSLVGSLLYAAQATRPDIQYAVSAVAKYCSAPDQSHLTAAKRILRYLKKTQNYVLWLEGSSDAELLGFSDADYARDVDDRHSTSGYVFMLGSGCISWYSGKQKAVSTSTAQAEYIALSYATREAIFLRQLLSEIKGDDIGRVLIREDNQAALSIAHNPVFYSRAKHIDVSYHFVREAVTDGQIGLEHCSSNDMIADLLTKPLSKQHFERLCTLLNLCAKL